MSNTKTEWVVQSLHDVGWVSGPLKAKSESEGIAEMLQGKKNLPKWKFRLVERTTTTTIEERVIE